MTIRAKKPEILSTVIVPIAIDMVNRQHQRLVIPHRFHPTKRTAVWDSYFIQSSLDASSTRPARRLHYFVSGLALAAGEGDAVAPAAGDALSCGEAAGDDSACGEAVAAGVGVGLAVVVAPPPSITERGPPTPNVMSIAEIMNAAAAPIVIRARMD